ncbi:hypothetical protein [Pseudomonas cerasi]
MSEALKTRKAHLTKLLSIINDKPGNTTETQRLTTKAISAEINFIEHRLKIPNQH